MKQIILFLLLAFSLSVGAQQGATFYAKQGATGNGSSWDNAGDLHSLLSRANSGSKIYLAAGSYEGGFLMKEGVNVLGGFPADATNATTLEDRRLPGTHRNLSIIDGANVMRPLTQAEPFNVETTWDGVVIANGIGTGIGTILYNGTNPVAVVYAYDSQTKIAKAISLHEKEQVPWAPPQISSKAFDRLDGSKNWDIMSQFVKDNPYGWNQYPAWNYIKQQRDANVGGYNDWYMPALQEMNDIYTQLKPLNTSLKRIASATPFIRDSRYWSSTEIEAGGSAYGVYIKYGYYATVFNEFGWNVRPIRVFTNVTLNQLGGGAYLQKNGVIANSIIKDCMTPEQGGGAYLEENAKIIGSLIENCIAEEASGVYVSPHSSLLSTTVVNNDIVRTPTILNANLPRVGDYYYADGTWGHSPANAIGIICAINERSPINGFIMYPEEKKRPNGSLDKQLKINDAILWASALGSGWELPSPATINSIYINKDLINNKLAAIPNSTEIPNKHTEEMWINAKRSAEEYMYMEFLYSGIFQADKNHLARARAVKAF